MAAKEEVLADRSDLLEAFRSAVADGVRDCFDYDAPRHFLRPHSKRSNTRDTIADKLREKVGGLQGVVISETNQTTYFSFLGKYKVLVKKCDDAGRVEMAKTQNSFEFMRQVQPVIDEEMCPEISNLLLSYADGNDPRDPQYS